MITCVSLQYLLSGTSITEGMAVWRAAKHGYQDKNLNFLLKIVDLSLVIVYDDESMSLSFWKLIDNLKLNTILCSPR